MPLISIRLSIYLYPSPQQIQSINQEIIQLSLQEQELLEKPESHNNCKRCKINEKIEEHNFMLTYAKPLAMGGIFSGTVCLFIGVIALFLIHNLGKKADKSLEQMHINFTRASHIIQTLILILPFNLYLSVSFILLLLSDGAILERLMISLCVIAGICFFYLYTYNKQDNTGIARVNGVLITPETNPKLWKLIKTIVQKLEVNTMPDNIVLCIGNDFKVSNQAFCLNSDQTVLTGNTLYLDSTYINYLTLAELCGIIAHELSHIASNDLNSSINLNFQIDKLIKKIFFLRNDYLFYPAYLLSKLFYDSFNRAINWWYRSIESRADLDVLKVIPKEHFALALSKIHLLGAQIDQALENYYHKIHINCLPLDYVTNYVAQSETPPLSKLLKISPSIYDQHPTLAQRLSSIKYRDLNRLSSLLISISPTSTLKKLFSKELNTLQSNYQNTMNKIAEADLNNLKNISNQHQETITLKQGGVIRLFLRTLLAGLFILITHGYITTDEAHDSDWLISIIIFSMISAFCLFRCYKMYKSIGSALFTMKPRGLILPCFDKAIPWEQINAFNITENMYKKLNIYLNPAFKPGEFKPCNAKIKYDKQNNHIQISAYEIKGKIKLPDCGPLISDYITVAHARLEMQLFMQNKK